MAPESSRARQALSRRRLLQLALLVVVAAAGIVAGRQSVEPGTPTARGSFQSGYVAGREAAFSGYDGGWAYGTPYVVTLARGGPGITYRFASRSPMMPGLSYYLCGRAACDTRGR